MTKTELLEQIVKKQDELIAILNEIAKYSSCVTNNGMMCLRELRMKSDTELSKLKKRLEKCEKEECEKKDYSHLCCICHENWVDSDNGIDTCDTCMNRI